MDGGGCGGARVRYRYDAYDAGCGRNGAYAPGTEGNGDAEGAGGAGIVSRGLRGAYRAYGRGGGARNSGVMPACGGGYRFSCPSCPSWASASLGRLAEIIGRAGNK